MGAVGATTAVATTNGNGAKPGALDKAKAWFGERSELEKGAIVIGGVAVAGLLLMSIFGGYAPNKKRYKPNLSRGERARVMDAKPGSYVKVGKKRYKVGTITTVKGGRKFGHKIPPKKYRQLGATRPDDYAWPKGYMYPVVFRTKTGRIKPSVSRKKIRAAASYYGKNKDQYPLAVRRTIARNINKAKKRFGIGGNPATA
jgi:hypothetical protein